MEHSDLCQRFGKTKGGAPRWRCKGCAKTFSTGKPSRRHKRSDKNRLVLDMLCNDLSLAKVSKNSGLAYRDIHRRIGCYHDQVRSFVTRREDFSDAPLIFVMDGDAGLKQSFATVFQPEVAAGRAQLAVIDFAKAMTNDMRNCVVADGRTVLCAPTGLTPTELSLIPSEFFAEIVDEEVAVRLVGEPVGGWFPVSVPDEE